MNRLRGALSGRVSSEEEVLESLGDPRLLAKTIAQTQGTDRSEAYSDADYRNVQNQDAGYGSQESEGGGWRRGRQWAMRIPGWLIAVLAVIVVVLIAAVFLSLMSFLMPILLIMAAAFLLARLFLGWLK